jgi:hypothetical protein
MSKPLCKSDDEPKLKPKEAKFECRKCGRPAKKEKQVCKPHKI